jgi:hypothetical protein
MSKFYPGCPLPRIQEVDSSKTLPKKKRNRSDKTTTGRKKARGSTTRSKSKEAPEPAIPMTPPNEGATKNDGVSNKHFLNWRIGCSPIFLCLTFINIFQIFLAGPP